MFHIALFGDLEFFLGGPKPTKAPCGDGTGHQQTSISKTVRVTKPCQLGHRPSVCSAVITTSYVLKLLRWTTLFSAAS